MSCSSANGIKMSWFNSNLENKAGIHNVRFGSQYLTVLWDNTLVISSENDKMDKSSKGTCP